MAGPELDDDDDDDELDDGVDLDDPKSNRGIDSGFLDPVDNGSVDTGVSRAGRRGGRRNQAPAGPTYRPGFAPTFDADGTRVVSNEGVQRCAVPMVVLLMWLYPFPPGSNDGHRAGHTGRECVPAEEEPCAGHDGSGATVRQRQSAPVRAGVVQPPSVLLRQSGVHLDQHHCAGGGRHWADLEEPVRHQEGERFLQSRSDQQSHHDRHLYHYARERANIGVWCCRDAAGRVTALCCYCAL